MIAVLKMATAGHPPCGHGSVWTAWFLSEGGQSDSVLPEQCAHTRPHVPPGPSPPVSLGPPTRDLGKPPVRLAVGLRPPQQPFPFAKQLLLTSVQRPDSKPAGVASKAADEA